MTPVVTLDIDGVLADFLGPYGDLLRDYGAPVPPGEPSRWAFDTEWPHHRTWAWNSIHAEPAWWATLPKHRDWTPLAKDSLARLRSYVKVHALTARPAPATEATRKWLHAHVGPVPVICSDGELLKIQLLEEVIHPWALIDDNPSILASCPEIPLRILVNRAYNQLDVLPGVLRVGSTLEALETLHDQLV